MRFPHSSSLLLSLLLITGCQPQDPARAMLEDYAYRIANVLELDLTSSEPVSAVPTFPPRRERRLATRDFRIGFFDFLDLKACDMRHLVSQRNSVLGRVMPPSRQLVYEVELLHALQACEAQLRASPPDDPDLTELISEALAQKRAELPIVVWNASFANEEIERALSLSRGHLQPGDSPLLQEASRELLWFATNMRSVLNGGPAPEVEELESHYQALAFNPAPGQLVRSLTLASTWLQHVTGMLAQVDAQRLCPQRKPTRKAKILQTVFQKFYAEQLQGWISMLHRDGSEWRIAFGQFVALQRVQRPESFNTYTRKMLESDDPDSLPARFQTALLAHTEHWKALFGQCGMMPSRPSGHPATG